MTTTVTPQTERAIPRPLTDDALQHIDAYWRAANYLSVGQIYLLANPLLREPLALEHIKPRLLGHWGTTPGLNFVYVHLNRVIRERDLDVIYVTGPGHGGPGLVANTYLEGTYSELYPSIGQNAEGLRRLFKQFSFPGGIPSHHARGGRWTGRPVGPLIVLRTPKGWTGPKEVDGKPVEDTWRAQQVPLSELATKPEHLRQLEEWMRSYRPEELFDAEGKLVTELAD